MLSCYQIYDEIAKWTFGVYEINEEQVDEKVTFGSFVRRDGNVYRISGGDFGMLR